MSPRQVPTDRILDAALVVISRQGARKSTLVDIAAEAGISRHTVHRRFPTQELLLAAVGERIVHRFEEELFDAAMASPDPTQRVRAIATCILRLARDQPLGRTLELDPLLQRSSAERFFASWTRSVVAALTWPAPPAGRADAAPLYRAAELIQRYAMSYQIVAPRDWSEDLETLINATEAQLSATALA